MLTKDDKKFVIDSIKNNNDVLVKEMIDLFNATNSVIEKVDNKLSDKIDGVEKRLSEKIDDTNDRIDRVLDNLKSDFDSIENLEKRTEKLEKRFSN